jgi:phage tail protein X
MLGDTWDIVSLRVYGDEGFAGILTTANPRHANTVIFSAGIVLTIPPQPAPSIINNLPPWRTLEVVNNG